MNKYKLVIQEKDRSWSGLEKVPDSAVISQLRTELGKANSYIDELEAILKERSNEDRLSALEDENRSLRENLRVLQGLEMKKRFAEKVKALKTENDILRKTISDLICRLNKEDKNAVSG